MAMNVNVILKDALRMLEAERVRLDRQLAAINTALTAVDGSSAPRRRTKLSAAKRAAISKRMKAYWAKRQAAAAATSKSQTKKAEAKQNSSTARAKRPTARPKKGTVKKPIAAQTTIATASK